MLLFTFFVAGFSTIDNIYFTNTTFNLREIFFQRFLFFPFFLVFFFQTLEKKIPNLFDIFFLFYFHNNLPQMLVSLSVWSCQKLFIFLVFHTGLTDQLLIITILKSCHKNTYCQSYFEMHFFFCFFEAKTKLSLFFWIFFLQGVLRKDLWLSASYGSIKSVTVL